MYIAVSSVRSVLTIGSKGSGVRQLQQNLNDRFQRFGVVALISVRVDGFLGPETSTAVRYLQCVGGLPVNGRVDEATWAFIEQGVAGLRVLAVGSECTQVTAVQQTILGSGVPVVVDGYYGEETAQAVALYQQKMGLIVSGIVGCETWEWLVRSRLTDLPCAALLPNLYRR